jgi:hypothetical protein
MAGVDMTLADEPWPPYYSSTVLTRKTRPNEKGKRLFLENSKLLMNISCIKPQSTNWDALYALIGIQPTFE